MYILSIAINITVSAVRPKWNLPYLSHACVVCTISAVQVFRIGSIFLSLSLFSILWDWRMVTMVNNQWRLWMKLVFFFHICIQCSLLFTPVLWFCTTAYSADFFYWNCNNYSKPMCIFCLFNNMKMMWKSRTIWHLLREKNELINKRHILFFTRNRTSFYLERCSEK